MQGLILPSEAAIQYHITFTLLKLIAPLTSPPLPHYPLPPTPFTWVRHYLQQGDYAPNRAGQQQWSSAHPLQRLAPHLPAQGK